MKFYSKVIDEKIRTAIYAMKCQKVKMLCFSIYCLLSSGCGKAVSESSAPTDEVRRDAIEASTLKLSNQQAANSEYTFSELGDVYIPGKLRYISGNSANSARIFFAKDDPVEEVYCLYTNQNADDDLELVDCYTQTDFDNDGLDDPMNYEEGYSIIMTENKKLELETDSNVVEALLDVEWH